MHIVDSNENNTAFRVFVVDDNTAFRTVITKQLEKMGGCVESAEDASGFLSNLATSALSYDLCVIDLQLPGLHGDQIITWLRESEECKVRTMPILIVTGFPTELSDGVSLDGATTALLSKPYTYSDLKEQVFHLLSNSKRDN
ncbi:response regulator [Lentibacter algarum]|uniref:response regulator n=1 Tax=Lentibacter algarum TaxID=576131 RepID=UPI001C090500|nr:response regulator [Lentibacter algarum]MBU2983277.1 response regulator [Lentibacter algarum]